MLQIGLIVSLFVLFEQSQASITGWTNVNLLYFPDSIEIAYLEGLTLWCPEINQSKQLLV